MQETFPAGYVKRTIIEPVAVHIPVEPTVKEGVVEKPGVIKGVEKPTVKEVAGKPVFLQILEKYKPILPWLTAGISLLSFTMVVLALKKKEAKK